MRSFGNRARTRSDRETAFVQWVHSARLEKVQERSVDALARDYAVPVDLVKRHLATRLGQGKLA